MNSLHRFAPRQLTHTFSPFTKVPRRALRALAVQPLHPPLHADSQFRIQALRHSSLRREGIHGRIVLLQHCGVDQSESALYEQCGGARGCVSGFGGGWVPAESAAAAASDYCRSAASGFFGLQFVV